MQHRGWTSSRGSRYESGHTGMPRRGGTPTHHGEAHGSTRHPPVSQARARLADVVDEARTAHDPVYLTRRGQRIAAVIAADDLERLIAAAEDLADVPAAARQLRKLDAPARRRVQAAIELLATDPRPPGAVQLVGGSAEFRVRTGDYRIVYDIHEDVLVVLVVAVGHRREAYER